jgi:hypothetical protein
VEESPVVGEALVPQHPVHHRAGPRGSGGQALARVEEHPHAIRVDSRAGAGDWASARGGRRHRAAEDGGAGTGRGRWRERRWLISNSELRVLFGCARCRKA